MPKSFDQAYQAEERAERIFAFHLARLGLSRVLDIGSNTGQFARKLRELGYGGLIYSVEPQPAAYSDLLANAADDHRWLPTPRQAASDAAGRVEVSIAENSSSSSILEAHENRLRAEPSTTEIDHELIETTKTADILRSEIISGIHACRIDVPRYCKRVMDGFGSLISNVGLLAIEMSLVECFSLDKTLTGELGFSRVSLEPARYDDHTGVVQEYVGVYYRPELIPIPNSHIVGPTVSVAVTSVGGSTCRLRSDGVDIGEFWRDLCLESWKALAPKVLSVSEVPAPDNLVWIESPSRPALSDLLRHALDGTSEHVLLVNGDIVLTDLLSRLLPGLAPECVYYGCRHEVKNDVSRPSTLDIVERYEHGFDYFLLPRNFIQIIIEQNLLPREFLIGEPWWDYLIPILAFTHGFPIKKFPQRDVIGLHYSHEVQFSFEKWTENGKQFLACLQRLREAKLPHAKGLIAELLEPEADLTAHLRRVAKTVCFGLP